MGLFSTTVIHKEKEAVPYEKRVVYEGFSADKAGDLYSKLRDKAEQDFLATVELKNNLLEAKACIFEDIAYGSKRAVVAFKLNGKEHTFETHIDFRRGELSFEDKTKMLSVIRDFIANQLAIVFTESEPFKKRYEQ